TRVVGGALRLGQGGHPAADSGGHHGDGQCTGEKSCTRGLSVTSRGSRRLRGPIAVRLVRRRELLLRRIPPVIAVGGLLVGVAALHARVTGNRRRLGT